MKRIIITTLCLLLFIAVSTRDAKAGLYFGGGSSYNYNYSSALSKGGNLGYFTAMAGYSLLGYLGINGFFAYDLGTSFSYTDPVTSTSVSAKVKYLHYGAEARLKIPMIPIYVSAGLGMLNTKSSGTLAVGSFSSGSGGGSANHFAISGGAGLQIGIPMLPLSFFGGGHLVFNTKVKEMSYLKFVFGVMYGF